MLYRWDILNKLIKDNDYKSYLEIGYYKGWSFDRVECDFKLAVDPNPSKAPEQESAIYGSIIYDEVVKLTSDDFFKKYHDTYDIIFIDGLHEAGQVVKDIRNAVEHLNQGGVIVLHDCNPPEFLHTTTGIDGCWTGDTYKAVLGIETEYSCKFKVVDTDWGVGILKLIGDGKQSISCLDSNLLIDFDAAKQDWDYFSVNRDKLINLITPEEWLKN